MDHFIILKKNTQICLFQLIRATGEYKDETFYESNSILIVKYLDKEKGEGSSLEEGAFSIKDDKGIK